MCFDREGGAWVPPRPGRAQLGRLLEASYALEPSRSDPDHRRFAQELRRRQKKRALVVVITDFVDLDGSEALLQILPGLAKRHAVLWVALRDPALRKNVNRSVSNTSDAYRSVVALGLQQRRAELMERLRRLGLSAVDAEPSEVSAQTIRSYLALRGRQ